MKTSAYLLIAYLLLLFPLQAYADTADDAWNAYLTGDFRRVEQLAITAGADTALAPDRRALIFFSLGSSYAMQNKDLAAYSSFKQAFQFDPLLRRNPIELPPPVWRVFKTVQDSITSLDVTNSPKKAAIPVVTRIDTVRIMQPTFLSKGAITRSLAFPGWGHIYENDRRGYKFLLGETILIAGFIYVIDQTDRAERKYLSAKTTPDISKYYNRYNSYYKLSWGLGTAVAAGYLIAQWDFFSRPLPIKVSSNFSDRLELSLNFTL